MNKDSIEGKARKLRGRVKSGIGAATGAHKLQIAGLKDRVVGEVQEQLGRVSDVIARNGKT